jgi:NADH-quinone oxidoreductase subunit M
VPSALSQLIENNLLSTLVFLPLASVTALLLLQPWVRLSDLTWKVVALVTSVVGFGLSLELWSRFDSSLGEVQFVEHVEWIPDFGITYYMGVDGISLFLVVLTCFLSPIILLASWSEITKRVKEYVFFMLALQTGMLGAFLALNMFLFYVFWEVMLIPMYFVIGIWGGPRRLYATVKFFIYTMVGSLLMLVGILVLAYLHFQQFGVLTFDYFGVDGATGILDTMILTGGAPWWQTQHWLFAVFGLAFAIKVPMFPFHTWLPDAHVEAPTPGSAVLAGVLLKLGTYGFVRYALPLFPQAVLDLSFWVIAVCCIGIVYGALVAMVQTDVKKLIAYSSVSHMGFIVLGTFALNPQGLQGSILQMVNHGVSTGALFILVGMLYERRHEREISAFGGLAHMMPIYTTFFLLATLSSIGLPALNGFVGEFLILLGAFATSPFAAVVATTGVILAAVYMLWMVRRVFFGPVVHEINQRLSDLSPREKLVAAALAIPMVWIGVYPASFLVPMNASVEQLLRTMEERGADIASYNGGHSSLVRIAAPESAESRGSGDE